MLTMDKIRATLKAHGVIFEEYNNGHELRGFRCFVYGWIDSFDLIRWNCVDNCFWLIDPAGNSEKLTADGLERWLGY